MAGRRYTAGEIGAKLAEAAGLVAAGLPHAEVARRIGVSPQTYARWRGRDARPAPRAPSLCPPPVPAADQSRAVAATRRAFPGHFPDAAAAAGFLFQVILPPSRRWGFISVGKNASSTTLRLLFRAEFGCDMTVQATPAHDINPAAALHMLVEHGVFTRAAWQGLSAPDLLGARGPGERICVVREPFDRAVSGFRYLCRSHRARSLWFARDRFRMNAALGFDWSRHPDTAEGFRLFLRYIAWQVETEGRDAVDAHWRPQATFIKPEVFRPTLTGRMEDMAGYCRSLSERLGGPPPDTDIRENRQPDPQQALRTDREARRLCEALYAIDYEAFGY
ncbi:transposase (plasmid) [Paroceanicella profunda]|uniref:Transposase n=1 Tax=Paroceanicella profunda TaxID=2579971 RepID=A0A5B8G5R7_9RHOB|nr:sulfotransferase family 2 domain-containing protein [Paroceanicella profunda]QDL94702.1 transposase [Paroceanicella profunda]